MKKGFGDILKSARVAKNMTPADVNKKLKIDTTYVEALENEELDLLEKPIYKRMFLRTYAKFLGVDEEEVIKLLLQDPEFEEEPKKKKDIKSEIKQEIKHEPISRELEETKDRALGLLNKQNIIIASSIAAAILLAVIIIFAVRGGRGSMKADESKGVYMVPQETTLKIEASAKSDVWIKARHDNGTEDFLLKEGEVKKWKDIRKIVFLIGNAAGIEFNVNGDNIGVIGEEGEVINGLVFEVGKNWYIDRSQGFKRQRPKPTETSTPISLNEDAESTTITAENN